MREKCVPEKKFGFDIDELVELCDSGSFKCHIDTFRNYFIPAFEKGGDNVFTGWSTLIGGPTKKAQLVNSEGVVLYTVPPVLSGLQSLQNGNSMTKIANKAVLLSNTLPGRRDAELNKLKNEINEDFGEHYQDWLKLLADVLSLSNEDIDGNVKESEQELDDFTDNIDDNWGKW